MFLVSASRAAHARVRRETLEAKTLGAGRAATEFFRKRPESLVRETLDTGASNVSAGTSGTHGMPAPCRSAMTATAEPIVPGRRRAASFAALLTPHVFIRSSVVSVCRGLESAEGRTGASGHGLSS